MIKKFFSKLFNSTTSNEIIVSEDDYWITTRKLENSKYCSVSEDEEVFIRNLILKSKLSNKKYYFVLERKSNKAITVFYKGVYVGRFKLQGRKTWMQILLNLDSIRVLENEELDTYINSIDLWIDYINRVRA